MRRYMKKIFLITVSFVLLSFQVFSASLDIGRDQDSIHMDPILVSQNADVWVLNNMHSLIVRNNRDATGIEPDLAESWDISSDGKTYTFNLRDNLKFNDGTPLKSTDAKFSIERLRDGEGSVFGSMFGIIDSIDTPDDRTVVFNLKEASTPFLSFLALFAAAILPEDQVTNDYDNWVKKSTGAGAFKMTEWAKGSKLVLEKNEYYWESGLPKLDKVTWHYIPNDNTRIIKMQAGEIDAIIFVPFNKIAELDANNEINVNLDPSSRMDHILMNHSHKPLDDVRVRKALNLGIDVDSIIKTVAFGYATPANSYVPAGGMYYHEANKGYGYDPDQARQLLDDAGVSNLDLDFVLQAGDANFEQIGVLVKDQLGKIGVNVNLIKQESGQAWETIVDGAYDLNTNYWTNDVIDPDQKTGFVLYGDDPDALSYYTRYNNPKVNEMINKARLEQDASKRKQLYYDIQQTSTNDAHWIHLYYSPFRNAARTNVNDFYQNPMGRFMLETTSVSN